MSSEKHKRPKFKHTKELIRIALNDGMTQDEIAKLCRVQQSVVSKWNSGKSRAFHDQIARLLKRYGTRLNRTTARVYLVVQSLSGCTESRLEHSELGRQVPRYYDEALAHRAPTQLVRIEGTIIFRYPFRMPVPKKNNKRTNDIEMTYVPIGRWLLHHQGRDRFVLVRQYRRILIGEAFERWKRYFAGCPDKADVWVESADDAARWLSRVHDPMTSDELLAFVDKYLADETMRHNPHDEAALPFLLRKTLVEHGYEVPGLVFMTSGE